MKKRIKLTKNDLYNMGYSREMIDNWLNRNYA